MENKGIYNSTRTAILLIDPFNDFLHENGKLWAYTKAVAEEINLVSNIKNIVESARAQGLKIFYIPHHKATPEDYQDWKYINNSQKSTYKSQLFAKGSWGADFLEGLEPKPGDIIVKEHWAQSGFANTDLDQQLKVHDIDKIIIIGMLANTCIESTARFGMELGYHVTLVTDAAGAMSWQAMDAAFKLNAPTYAHQILDTKTLVQLLQETV